MTELPSVDIDADLQEQSRVQISDSLRMVAPALHDAIDLALAQIPALGAMSDDTSVAGREALADVRRHIRKIASVFDLARAYTPAKVLRLAIALCDRLIEADADADTAAITPALDRCLWALHDYLDALLDKSGDNTFWDLPLYAIYQQFVVLLGQAASSQAAENSAAQTSDGVPGDCAAYFKDALRDLLDDRGMTETAVSIDAMCRACREGAERATTEDHAVFLRDVHAWLRQVQQGAQPLSRHAVRLLQAIARIYPSLLSAEQAETAQTISNLALLSQQMTWLRVLAKDGTGSALGKEETQLLVKLMLQVDRVLTTWHTLVNEQEQPGGLHAELAIWEWQRQLWLAAVIAKKRWPRLRGEGMSGFLLQLANLSHALVCMPQRESRNREVSSCLIFVEECLRKRTYLEEGFIEQTDCILDHLAALSLASEDAPAEPFPWFSRELRADMARRMEGIVERGLQASLREIERSLESLWSLSGIDAMRVVTGMTSTSRMVEPLHITPSVLMADLNAELLQIESCVAPLQSLEMQKLAHQLRQLIGEKLEMTLQFGFSSKDSPEKRRSEAARARMVRDIARLGQLLEQSRRSPRNRWRTIPATRAQMAASSARDLRHALVATGVPAMQQDATDSDGVQWALDADFLHDTTDRWQPLEQDAEMMQIFLAESRQLLSVLADLLPELAVAQHDQSHLTELRRCFHTFKVSGRMVGLDMFSDAASAAESLVNACLAAGRDVHPYTPPAFLAPFFEKALVLFDLWIGELETQRGSQRSASSLVDLAHRLRGTVRIPAAAVDTDNMPVSDAVLAPTDMAFARQGASARGVVRIAPDINPTTPVIDPALRHIYLNEVHRLFKILRQHGSSWRAKVDSGLVVGPPALYARAIHTLKGCSGTAGLADMYRLAGALDGLLEKLKASGRGLDAHQLSTVEDAVAAMMEIQQAFEVGTVINAQTSILERVKVLAQQFEDEQKLRLHPVTDTQQPVQKAAAGRGEEMLGDELDHQLLPVFLEEGQDLMALIGDGLHRYQRDPAQQAVLVELQRPLHTLKGSARMAGALRLGQRMHALESSIEQLLKAPGDGDGVEGLLGLYDQAVRLFDELEQTEAQSNGSVATPVTMPATTSPATAAEPPQKIASPMVRIKAGVLDTLLNQVGEVSIARSQLENEVESLQQVARELAGNIAKLAAQLRDVEIQAEIQITASHQSSHDHAQFDPLELDRFTHLQELTRMMAESVNDAASLQRLLVESARNTQDGLLRQGRLTRELQQELIYTRMVKFRSAEQRFVHLVWQMGKETGKSLHFDLSGGEVELDRSILEKMLGPLEHLLRNAAVHGIETPEVRERAGKSPTGRLHVAARQEGNEVIISVGDDGGGLDIQAIREKALALALLSPDQLGDEARIADMIFESGLSTSSEVSSIAGRGVGMDVVRSEVTALGGRVTVATTPGKGVLFTVHLPISLAVTQVTLVRLGAQTYAIPSMLVDKVVQLTGDDMRAALSSGVFDEGGRHVVLHGLGGLLDHAHHEVKLPPVSMYVLFIKSSSDLVAVTVDHVIGNREVVTKKVGPQLGTLVGLAGATVLGNGDIALIINPLLLARRLGYRQARYIVPEQPLPAERKVVMVVDDSLTVRKVTERLLSREGYLVVTATDGFDAIRQLHELTPDIFLVDIEMPRMDGFTLARHLRDNAATRGKPIIVITSRTGEKHRARARELGVEHYLGKPYQDEHLLALIKTLIQHAPHH